MGGTFRRNQSGSSEAGKGKKSLAVEFGEKSILIVDPRGGVTSANLRLGQQG